MDVLRQPGQANRQAEPTTPPPKWLVGLWAYIEAHATEDLTLDDLAAQAQFTPRALQYAFRQHLNTTPMRYLRQQKLRQVNQALKARMLKTAPTTVTQVAVASGFTNLGIFARYYQQEFGELPSRTLCAPRVA